jgi:hypothetical protein
MKQNLYQQMLELLSKARERNLERLGRSLGNEDLEDAGIHRRVRNCLSRVCSRN